ncbi:unnamed protein product, partial [Medioppia subpectinata]
FNKEITPPFIPAINRNDNLFYFDKEFTNKAPEDSPGVPPSANAHELFRGFSFVATNLLEETLMPNNENNTNATNSYESPKASQSVSRILLRTITKCKERSLHDYEFFEELGKGSYSCCRRCVHKETAKQYAVKIIDKSKRDCAEEVAVLLRYSQHSNIVTLHDVYEDTTSVYLFMDLMSGGELLDKILNQKYFNEREASAVLEVIATTIKFLHENGVIISIL